MRLTKQNIFILGLMRFDGPFESTNYTIAKHLAKDNQVFYIDNPFTWKDCIKLKSTSEHAVRKPHMAASATGIIQTNIPGLKIIITPPVASINMLPEGFIYRLVLKVNENIIRKRINKVIESLDIREYIFINSYNFHYPGVADLLSPSIRVYHCVDPLIRPFDIRHGVISEEQLVRSSDLVFCTSRQLYEEKKKKNPNTYFVPNAADISHSQKALDANLPVSNILEGFKKPIIGYFGNIERRIDYDLIKETAKLNPDKSFVFVGPQEREFIPEWFFNTPNIHLTGKVSYEQMPNVIKGFDVALIPFKKDEVSRTIFPLKLFEYLGAGKPVVATDFNSDLEEFTKGLVPYCTNATTFSGAIEMAVKNNGQDQDKWISIASENTWEQRMVQITDLLYKYLWRFKQPEG